MKSSAIKVHPSAAKPLQYAFSFWLLAIGVIVTCSPAYSQVAGTKNDTSYIQLINLLHEKDFFRLEHQFRVLKQTLEPPQQLFFETYLANAFNKNQEAIGDADSLLNNFAPELQDSLKAALYLLKGDSYFKLFEYQKATENDSILLSRYQNVLDSNETADVKNKLIIYDGLRKIPPQKVSITQRATFRWKRNKIGLVEIPVKVHGASYDAVFDTRANISVITQTYATTLSLQSLPVFYYEGSGITGIRFKTSLAVADSLHIGNALIRHAVFQVVPDSVLYIAPVDFQINIIIGFPIIEQLKEMHFYKDGRMEIPVNPVKSNVHNLALNGLDPVVMLRTGSGDKLCFAFDFGASKSVLFAAYFQRYRDAVLANGVKTTAEYGGAGGTQQKEVITLPFVELFLNEQKVRLDSVDVLSKKIYPEETFYGNIGQDFVNVFQELIINFRDMYIKGR